MYSTDAWLFVIFKLIWFRISAALLKLKSTYTVVLPPTPNPVPSLVPSPVSTPVLSPVPSPVLTPVSSPVPSPGPSPVPSPVPTPVPTPVPSPVSTSVPYHVPCPRRSKHKVKQMFNFFNVLYCFIFREENVQGLQWIKGCSRKKI